MVDPYPDGPAQRTANTGTWIDRHRSPREYNQVGPHATDRLRHLRIRVAERGDIEQRGYLYAEENSRLHASRFKGLVGVRWTLSIGDCLPLGPCLVDECVMQPEQWIGR